MFVCESAGNDCDDAGVLKSVGAGLEALGGDDDGDSASDSNAPNESSAMKSSLGGGPRDGNARACGRGDGGAGHRPGRAAARSIRLRVCRCCDALTFFSPCRATLIDWC